LLDNSNEILGGYIPVAWNLMVIITPLEIVLYFKNNNRIENYILSRVINEKHSIYNTPFGGPSFGGDDLNLLRFISKSGDCISRKNSYDKSIRKTENHFFVEECEVFQIV